MAETIRLLVSEEDVDKRIMELGKKISEDYAGKQVHLICVDVYKRQGMKTKGDLGWKSGRLRRRTNW